MSVDAVTDGILAVIHKGFEGEDTVTLHGYRGLNLPEGLISEPVYFFEQDPEGLYMRLDNVARILMQHGIEERGKT